jgi:hypothetical protein
VSLSCFSQTNTNNQSQVKVSDTTKVKLKPSTARAAIKDIVRGEGCEVELKLTQEKVVKLEEREVQKDTIISLLESKDNNNKYIINQQGLMIGEFKTMTDDLKKELKQTKSTSFWYKVGTFLGVISTSYLLLVR